MLKTNWLRSTKTEVSVNPAYFNYCINHFSVVKQGIGDSESETNNAIGIAAAHLTLDCNR